MMDRKKTTEFLGNLLVLDRFGGMGKYWAKEVSIDPWAAKGKPNIDLAKIKVKKFIQKKQRKVFQLWQKNGGRIRNMQKV